MSMKGFLSRFRRSQDQRPATPSTPRPFVEAEIGAWLALAGNDSGAQRIAPPGVAGALEIDAELIPILGEFAWHTLTVDPTLDAVGNAHFESVAALLRGGSLSLSRGTSVLEIAAYAHTTGFRLARDCGVTVDLFDISRSTLRLGRRCAVEAGLPMDATRCVAGDFHDLPYADGQFDLVYICSALHHTWRWRVVVAEMIRVLAPGGILLLENEPTARAFCHYGFRTQRAERYGGLEKALDDEGILRCIAEPFPGTRPEGLFGMVENQTIPLAELLRVIHAECMITTAAIDAGPGSGAFESELLARRVSRAGRIETWLRGELLARLARAEAAQTDADRAMGLTLPPREGVDALCTRVAHEVATLPDDEQAIDYRMRVAQLFGAATRIVAVKRGTWTPGRRRLLKSAASGHGRDERDFVAAFPPHVARLLDPARSLIPDIQSVANDALAPFFPPEDWRIEENESGVRTLYPRGAKPRIFVVTREAGMLLLVFRLYVAADDMPFRVALRRDDADVAVFDAWKAESLLLSAIIEVESNAGLQLDLRTTPLRAADAGAGGTSVFTIAYAGAIAL